MSNLLTIKQAGELINVSTKTLRRWEDEGRIKPIRTKGNHRRYDISDLMGGKNKSNLTICYARVSGHDQKEDLKRQSQVLEAYASNKGFTFELIQDLGSGMNYKKKGLVRLIKLICSSCVERLIITHKDRLLRFGSELIFSLCEHFGVEVIMINKSSESTYEEDLTSDVLEIITVFSARLYGSRSHKNKKIVQQLNEIAMELK